MSECCEKCGVVYEDSANIMFLQNEGECYNCLHGKQSRPTPAEAANQEPGQGIDGTAEKSIAETDFIDIDYYKIRWIDAVINTSVRSSVAVTIIEAICAMKVPRRKSL
jgi:hypothetical protein